MDLESAFLSGLLIDLGRTAILFFAGQFRRAGDNKVHVSAETVNRISDAVHAEIGAYVLKSWSFPEDMVSIMRHYQEPEGADERLRRSAHAIHAADLLAHALTLGEQLPEEGRERPRWLQHPHECLGINLDRAIVLSEEIRAASRKRLERI